MREAKWEIRRDGCTACGFGDIKCIRRGTDDDPYWLCELCWSTASGNEMKRPTEHGRVLSSICYVGNAILEAVKKAAPPSEEAEPQKGGGTPPG